MNILKKLFRPSGFIFCISSGRSGTGYLADLLNTASNTRAYHEARPWMTDSFTEQINKHPYEFSYEERKIKVKGVLEKRERDGKAFYAETNHMFIKTFFDVVCQELDKVKVIHLRRGLLSTLKSFADLRYFSDKNPVSFEWMSSPNALTRAVDCIAPDAELDHIDLSLAYLIDIEARAERFKADFPHIKCVETTPDELNDRNSVEHLFNALKLKTTPETFEFMGRKVNHRQSRKKEMGEGFDKNYLRTRIEDYVLKAEEKQIMLPEFIISEHKKLYVQ